jgi:hypothetical protein
MFISVFEIQYCILIVIFTESSGGSTVDASSRQLNIDPAALLTGARPSQNVDAAVSFDEPAQFNATLHNAGKVWWF